MLFTFENKLSNQTLQAHCKSEDQNLGLQHISSGEQFQWGFHINLIWGTKVYFYNLSWPGGHRTFDAFATDGNIGLERWNPYAYDQHDLYLLWQAQDDGIYLFDGDEQKYNLQKTWGHS